MPPPRPATAKPAPPQGCELRLNTPVAGVDIAPDGVALKLASGAREPYDLVVGADGLRSIVRGAVLDAPPPPRYSGIRIQFGVAPLGLRPRRGARARS